MGGYEKFTRDAPVLATMLRGSDVLTKNTWCYVIDDRHYQLNRKFNILLVALQRYWGAESMSQNIF